MDEIIAMLEKAECPNNAIDAKIAKFVGWKDVGGYWLNPAESHYYQRKKGPPEFTNSIDDAVSLIPAGMYWVASFGKCQDDEPIGACQIFHQSDATVPVAEAEGNSVHIAICIAALKAMTPTSPVETP